MGRPGAARWALFGLAMALILAVLTSSWPLRLSSLRAVQVTVHGAAASIARAGLGEDARRQERYLEQLEAELAALDDSGQGSSESPRTGFVHRLRALVRG